MESFAHSVPTHRGNSRSEASTRQVSHETQHYSLDLTEIAVTRVGEWKSWWNVRSDYVWYTTPWQGACLWPCILGTRLHRQGMEVFSSRSGRSFFVKEWSTSGSVYCEETRVRSTRTCHGGSTHGVWCERLAWCFQCHAQSRPSVQRFRCYVRARRPLVPLEWW